MSSINTLLQNDRDKKSKARAIAISKIIFKGMLLLLMALLILLSTRSSYFKSLSQENFIAFQQFVRDSGNFAATIFFCITAALVAIGFPRLILCASAGAIFGFWYGLLLVQIATLLGAFVPFMMARFIRTSIMAKYGKKLKAIMELIEKGGTMAVMLARQLPITGGIMNLLLGLTPIKKRDFTFGTLLGTLPEAVPAVVLGNSFSYTNFKTSILSILLSIALLIIVWLFSGFLTLRFKKTETTLNT